MISTYLNRSYQSPLNREWCVLLVLILSSVSMNAQSQPAFAPGEILIRYEAGTDGHAVVEKASRAIPLDLTMLTPEIEKLSTDVGIPLQIVALNSGGWLTIAVNTNALNDQVVAFLNEHEHVASARAAEAASQGSFAVPPVHVQFIDGTKEAREVSSSRGNIRGKNVMNVAKQIEKDLAVPVGLGVDEGALAIHISMKDLVPTVVEKLQALASIKNAQPNYRVGGY